MSAPESAITANAPLREIPGDAGWPLIGNTFDFLHPYTKPHERYEQYGDISWVNAFGARWIVMLGPDACQFVLQNRGDLFASSGWEFFLHNFFHRGLMLLDFDEHRMHRRIMQGAFTSEALAGYLKLLNPRMSALLSAWPASGEVKIYDRLKELTLELASVAFIGRAPGQETRALTRAFLDTVQAPTDWIRFPLPGRRWRRGLIGRKVLETFFRRELPAKRAAPSNDLFARLCAARTDTGEQFSDDDVINHIIFVLMAAHDTSTITLTHAVYQLAKHPQWQERLRQESRALGKAELDYADLPKLETMSWVIKEALRLCAPVPGVARRAVRDCEYKGFRIPAGHLVSLNLTFSQTSHHFWHEPFTFDPERFSPARAEDKKHPFMFLPFGGGAHKCIGMYFGEMEVQAILHQLLLRYRWSVPDDYQIKWDYTSLPLPKDRLPVTLQPLA